jgi:hypothetical protein
MPRPGSSVLQLLLLQQRFVNPGSYRLSYIDRALSDHRWTINRNY